MHFWNDMLALHCANVKIQEGRANDLYPRSGVLGGRKD